MEENQSEDLAACRRAEAAVIEYRNWLRANRQEMLVLAGITDDRPRAAELFYLALMKRAGRV